MFLSTEVQSLLASQLDPTFYDLCSTATYDVPLTNDATNLELILSALMF